MLLRLGIAVGTVLSLAQDSFAQSIVLKGAETCVTGGSGPDMCVQQGGTTLTTWQIHELMELRRVLTAIAGIDQKTQQVKDSVTAGDASVLASIKEGNAQLTAMSKSLTEQVNQFQTDLRQTIQKRFESLPAELLLSPEIKQLREDILKEVDSKIKGATPPK